eukprot:CAMPEP_0194783862 /NCGR_PEP_ID=MMETSP0323_2-20130528/79453_1 /TAXON_ID=2866 ORGANISM="Crypthecodinium cohnii, Strain Seligo" /NCGR_SAMPLE_ID=MMETSP0323_2 /ASSEMBLY_ACC=CAM_ASM_000346 /LENGTH=139 /DNA_ID=CAMNT_0039722783 /DNA_START=95 /DNA_END=514 /DNA_ORIENTATION=-
MPWKYKPEQRSSTRGSSEKAAKSALLSVLGFSPEASLASVAGAALSEVLSVATKADAETSCSKTEVLILIIAPLNFASGQGPIPMWVSPAATCRSSSRAAPPCTPSPCPHSEAPSPSQAAQLRKWPRANTDVGVSSCDL